MFSLIRSILTLALLTLHVTHSHPIINGVEVPRGSSWPAASFSFAVSLQSVPLKKAGAPPTHFCGGTYLGSGWIVTANHCVIGFQNRSIYAYIGGRALNESRESALYKVDRRVSHPDFNRVTLAADIALLHVRPTAAEQPNLGGLDDDVHVTLLLPSRPVNRPAQSNLNLLNLESQNGGDEDQEECHIFGYGSASFYGPGSDTLRYGPLQPLGYEQCVERLGPVVAPATPNCGMFCAIGFADACRGDSGGGLVCRRRLTLEQVLNGESEDQVRSPYTLRGIISYGAGCGAPASPGVYTDVGFFRRWIDQYVGGEFWNFRLNNLFYVSNSVFF
ncbi:serine protease 56 isoform X1 [Culex quinquefasciatus]|uniref:serine protease 56 isoform X1 n=1 Tax=Culex quinquefasciatus TaxID=7176 RepID=UPI0018E35840|nr:serine protease 56 isoform X1 [Culex quinquefasciatus]